MIASRIATATVLILTLSGTSYACDPKSYTSYPREQVNELFSTLKEGPDELSRIQAYSDLSCSRDQTIRTLAMQMALKKGNPALLRGKALQDVVGNMRTYVIEFGPAQNMDQQTKIYVERQNGAITVNNLFYDEANACVSLGGDRTRCYPPLSMHMRGDRLDLRYDNDNLVGEFHLDNESTLVGRVKQSRGGFFPARIKLF